MIKVSSETITSMCHNLERPESIMERMTKENPSLAAFIIRYCVDIPEQHFSYVSVLATGIYKIFEKQCEVDELNKQFEN